MAMDYRWQKGGEHRAARDARIEANVDALIAASEMTPYTTSNRLRDANKKFVLTYFPKADAYCQNKSWHVSAGGKTIASGCNDAAHAWGRAAKTLRDGLARAKIEVPAGA